jgi:opacity protein-like surface antigen
MPAIGERALVKSLWIVLCLAVCLAVSARAQNEPYYSRLNTFSAYVEYSNTSSHVHWGVARKRRLVSVGGSYARRFNAPHWFDWTRHASVFYELEVAPLNFIEDQVATDVITFTGYPSSTYIYPLDRLCESFSSVVRGNPVGFSASRSCGTRWTYMGGISPVGFRVNARPRHRVQPFVDSHLGFVVSPRDVPVDLSSRMNFTFEFGAGVEMYRRQGQSVAVEYRLHHLSNAYAGYNNPGVDNQIIKVTYSFGRLRR